jgi:putative inorganic carbon (hco3(-)) transporter
MTSRSASVPIAFPQASRATVAYGAFLVFIFTVYSSAALLVPALEKIAPGKTVIAVAGLALAWSCGVGARPFILGRAAGGTALYLFFAVLVASPLWSSWADVTWAAVAESIKYLAAFVVAANVLDTRRRIRHAVAAIALASLFPAIGAIQRYLGGVDLVEGTRAAWLGVFGNPNFLAYHLVVSTPLALALREATPAGPHRGLIRLGWLAVVGLYVVAILLTGSRGGAVGLAAVLLLWLVRSLARGRVAVGAAAAVLVALMMTPASPWGRAETQATLSGEVDASAQGRIDAWRTATRMVYDNPVLGVGAGAFIPAYERYAPGDAGPARTAHNSFAMVAAELGLPALGVFGFAIIGGLLATGRVARRAPPRSAAIARGLQTGLFGFVVCSLTGGYAFTWPLYFVLGLAAAITLREEGR